MEQLKFIFLGTPCFEVHGKPVQVNRRKAVALAAYLTVTGRRCSRDKLAALFWPEFDQKKSRASLRRTLFVMIKALGKTWLDIDRETIMFKSSDNIYVDVNRFLFLFEKINFKKDKGNDCLPVLREAAAIFRDDFMTGFTISGALDFDDWQFEQSESLRLKLTTVLEHLVQCHIERREFNKALSKARRLADLNPLSEKAQRTLLRVFALNNQRSFALRHFEKMKVLLLKELDTSPEESTIRLVEKIRTGAFPENALPINKEERFKPPPSNLPAQSTVFVGRKNELKIIMNRLGISDIRLLSITGPGGIGKTRLAIQAAASLRNDFSDGVFFIPLAEFSSCEAMVSGLIKIMGLGFQKGMKPHLQLIHFLQHKKMLLVFDNFEQLMEGVAFIIKILESTENIKLLVTSRTRLMIREEHVFPLSGLSLPRLPVHPDNSVISTMKREFDALSLFFRTALTVKPDFDLNAENIDFVVQICRLVQGIPLGLILAAGWVEVYPPVRIAKEIKTNLDFLRTDIHDIPRRHQSMRVVFDSSFELMTEQEKEIFIKLAVFRNDFTPEAVAWVTGIDAGSAILILASLTRKSLLKANAETGRFEIHQLLGQYAGELLDAAGMTEEVKERHKRFYLDLLIKNQAVLLSDRLLDCRKEMDRDFVNISQAWMWAVETEDLELLLSASSGLYVYFDMHARYHEAEALFHPVKSIFLSSTSKPHPGWSMILLCWFDSRIQSSGLKNNAELSEIAEMGVLCLRAATMENEKGIWKASACLLNGVVSQYQKQYDRALRFYRQALKEDSDIENAFWVNIRIGCCHGLLCRPEKAIHRYQRSYSIGKENGDGVKTAWSLMNIGATRFSTGHLKEADACLREAIVSFRHFRIPTGLVWSYAELGIVAFFQGDIAFCKTCSEKAMIISREIDIVSEKYHRARMIRGFAAIIEADYDYIEKHLTDFSGLQKKEVCGDLLNLFLCCLQNDYRGAEIFLTSALDGDPAEYTPHFHVLLLIGMAAVLVQNKCNGEATGVLCMAFNHSYKPERLFKVWGLPERLKAVSAFGSTPEKDENLWDENMLPGSITSEILFLKALSKKYL